ncbi:MAG: hypothetical protein J5518_10565 [Lachnospiraceae bacterium]|nr:hypothetical protein [Lachnospiraceae bacterium]
MNKKLFKVLGTIMICLVACFGMQRSANAKPLDEIENFIITVKVNDDASLDMTYHLDWRVLDSDSEGPLTWVQIGAPNKNHVSNVTALSDTVSSAKLDGSKFRIDLDRAYTEGELVSFDFGFRQDYLYQVNKFHEGQTVYTYTPGWFDDIEVDELVILWAEEKVDSFTPEADLQADWYVFTTHLAPGEKYTVTVTYPNDAYGFDLSHTEEEDDSDPWYISLIAIVISLASIGMMVAFCLLFYFAIAYVANAGFGLLGYGLSALTGSNKKVTRTKIEYYNACPGCGGPRVEGQDICAYCGKNMIKSTETITEEQLNKEYKNAKNFKVDGDYKIGNSGNEFIRVSTVPITLSSYMKNAAKSSRGRGGGTSHHSSCAHSSCACACACACAGGGRAGCSNKDFYKTDLKLKYFENAKHRTDSMV